MPQLFLDFLRGSVSLQEAVQFTGKLSTRYSKTEMRKAQHQSSFNDDTLRPDQKSLLIIAKEQKSI